MFKTIIIDGERKQVFKSKIGTYGCYTYYIDEDGDFMYNRKIIRTRRFKNKA